MTRTTPRPSGAAATGWGVHPWADVLHPEPEHHHGTMAPAGQLWATLADLARFAAFLLGDTGDVLDPGTLEEMTVPAGVDSDRRRLERVRPRACRCCARAAARWSATAARCRASWPSVFVDREAGDGAVSLRNATSGARRRPARRPARPARATCEPPRRRGLAARSPRRSTSRCSVPGTGARRRTSLRLQPDGLLHLAGLGRPGRASRFRPAGDGTWVRPGRLLRRRDDDGHARPAGPRDLRVHPHAVRPGAAGARRDRGRRLALGGARCGDRALRCSPRPGGLT